MTESREVLIDAMDRVWGTENVLAVLREHPVAVLDLLENAKCETCGGSGYEHHLTRNPAPDSSACSACRGSGKLGRDGVLRLLGMNEVAAQRDRYALECSRMTAEANRMRFGVLALFDAHPEWRTELVDGALADFLASRVPVPEPSEGGK